MYDKFRNNEPMWSLANQLAGIRTESFKDKYHSKGSEEGIKKGIEIGEKDAFKQTCIKMIKKQYHQDCSKWVEGLSEKQIGLIYEYIFEEDEFEVFKQRIDKSN